VIKKRNNVSESHGAECSGGDPGSPIFAPKLLPELQAVMPPQSSTETAREVLIGLDLNRQTAIDGDRKQRARECAAQSANRRMLFLLW
jgi:hypothetical protein